MTDPTDERPRSSKEYFGLEGSLWEDRHTGRLSEQYLELLARTQRQLERALALGLSEASERTRVRALAEAVGAAQQVLTAARDAMREQDAPMLGTRA